jgi:hypothetical protein
MSSAIARRAKVDHLNRMIATSIQAPAKPVAAATIPIKGRTQARVTKLLAEFTDASPTDSPRPHSASSFR